MLNRLKNLIIPKKNKGTDDPRIVPQHLHGLNSGLISANALRVIEVLQKAGFEALLVGGGIRDLLLGGKPKDFDVATNATPEQVKKQFRSALIIGRRFRIVHVRLGREIIEVTTFRAHHDDAGDPKDAVASEAGLLLRDNVYGDIKSDAIRRDFTVNALYYDPSNGNILDFTQGLEDLQQRQLRIIGDPYSRYREDPVRMLRAVRFAAKLGFNIDPKTTQPILELGPLLLDIPPARLFEEVLKLMLNGSATATLALLQDVQLFQYLFPGTGQCLIEASQQEQDFVSQVVLNTDKRIRQKKRVTPAFIYAAFLWLPLQNRMRQLMASSNMPEAQAMQDAAQEVISQQLGSTAIPKRFLIPMREIWSLQLRLPHRQGTRAQQLLEHPRFRAAYDFLLLREETGEQLDALGLWWTRYQDVDEEERLNMTAKLGKPARRRRPRRRKAPSPSSPPTGK